MPAYKNYTSVFEITKGKSFYVIHQFDYKTRKHVTLLPYIFETKQQANRYIEDTLGGVIGVEKITLCPDKTANFFYKVQHLKSVKEKQIC